VASNFEDWLWLKLRLVLITESAVESADHQRENVTTTTTPRTPQQQNYTTKGAVISGSADFRTKLTLERLRHQIVLDYGRF